MAETPQMWSWKLSPFAGKARIALAIKQVDVELIEIDPANRGATLRALNPSSTVPVLVVGDVAIRESTPICEWAEETGPGPSLWPEDPAERAKARGLLRWVDDELTANFFLSCRLEAFGPRPGDPEDIVDVLRGRLAKRWKALEGFLAASDGPWLMPGEEPTLADLGAMPLAVRVPQWKPELVPDPGTFPLGSAWLEALREHPHVEQVKREGAPAPAPA